MAHTCGRITPSSAHQLEQDTAVLAIWARTTPALSNFDNNTHTNLTLTSLTHTVTGTRRLARPGTAETLTPSRLATSLAASEMGGSSSFPSLDLDLARREPEPEPEPGEGLWSRRVEPCQVMSCHAEQRRERCKIDKRRRDE